MPLKEPTGTGAKRPVKPYVPKKPKKPKNGKASKVRKGRKTAAGRMTAAKAFHEQTTSAGAEHPTTAGTTAGLPFGGVGSTAGASPRALLELSVFAAPSGFPSGAAAGLAGAILDLAGEGQLTVAHALAAWTHEQNRLANRAWRRPGGLQRMAGL